MKYQLSVVVEDNDDIKVRVDNPGDVNPWVVIGILEKVKVEYLLTTPTPKEEP